jgi:signal transduction histidine kinase
MMFINFSNLKIQSKITLTSIFQFIFVIIFIGFLVIFFVSRQTSEDAKDKLVSIASSRSNHIQTYLEDHIQLLQLVTSRTALRKTLATYNETGKEADLLTITNIIKDAIIPMPQFERICILGLAGKVLTSTNDKYCGRSVSDADFFIKGLKSEGVYFIEEEGVYKIYISGPIMLEGKVIGVGMTVIDFNDLKVIITDRTSLGETGEVLIAFSNEAGERKYPLKRLFEAEALPLEIQSEETAYPMKQALAGETGYFENTLDYRNERVSAATSYIDIANLGLVAKIDRSELFRANRQIFLFLILIFTFFILIYYLISKKVSSFISKPILDLQRGAREVENGNLDYSFGIASQDEVGQLTKSFNQMVKSIKEAKNEIEQKVQAQTKEIKDKAQTLADQRSAILNILEDVEKEKEKFEIASNKLSLATRSAQIGVWEWDVIKNVITWDDQTYKIYGIKKGDFGGAYEAWQAGLHPDDKKPGDDAIQMALRGEKDFTPIFRVVWPTGEIRYVQAYALVERDPAGKPLKMIGVNFDVTHEKEVDKAKTEFVSLASHQLRTPLSSINWYTEMLLNEDAGKINEDQKKYLNEVYTGSQRMVELVNSLLNVSRLDLGTFIINPIEIDVPKLIKNLLAELKPQIIAKKQNINETYEEKLPPLLADQNLLRMVLQNLLSNAVKYTPAGGTISAEAKIIDKEFVINISDTGMGIPKAQQDKIFMKLFRADNAKQSETEGTGLGLYIIKSIVDQAGGRVWFESEENKGTTFHVSFPMAGMKKKEGNRTLD